MYHLMYHSRATFEEALKQVMFFKKAKLMGEYVIGGSFQLCSCQTVQIFLPFVCILRS